MSVKIQAYLLSAILAAAALPLHAQNITVVRDAETGKLRAPTAEEAAKLQSSSVKSGPVQAPMQKFHANGARGVRLTDELVGNALVAVRNSDGTLKEVCFDSHEQADKMLQSGHVHTNNQAVYATE